MRLLDAQKLAVAEMLKWELFQRGWTFGFWHSRNYGGVCDDGKLLIALSKSFVIVNNEDAILELIRHEIAHALSVEDNNHGPQWQVAAKKVGCRFFSGEIDILVFPHPTKQYNYSV